MPLTPAFSIAQNPLYPNIIISVDTSGGSDVNIVSRRLIIQDYRGNFLVPDGILTTYNDWPLASSTLSLDLLTTDMAVLVSTQWLGVSGNVLYEISNTFALPLYNQQFLYQLVQGLVPTITLDTGYSPYLAELWTNILGAINAITIGNDLTASQACLNRASFLRINQSKYFNWQIF